VTEGGKMKKLLVIEDNGKGIEREKWIGIGKETPDDQSDYRR
jgi:hypothetical protein